LYPNGEVDPWHGLGVLTSPSKGIDVMMVGGASHHAWYVIDVMAVMGELATATATATALPRVHLTPAGVAHRRTHPSLPSDQPSVVAARLAIKQKVAEYLSQDCNQAVGQ
jgi:hypothetical protein